MKLFQWYGMMCCWIYIVPALALGIYQTSDPSSAAFRDAGLLNGQIGGFYNFVAFVAAFLMMPYTRKYGAKIVHFLCLTLAGMAMLAIPLIHDKWLLFLPMIAIGMAWASMMGNPYILLADCIPPARAGVYMGIFNMFIVIPMIVQMVTVPLMYGRLLGSDPRNVLYLAGICLVIAGMLTLRV